MFTIITIENFHFCWFCPLKTVCLHAPLFNRQDARVNINSAAQSVYYYSDGSELFELVCQELREHIYDERERISVMLVNRISQGN